MTEPPEEIYALTKSVEDAPNEPQYVEITFEKGSPVAVDGEGLSPVALITKINEIAGNHGVGRIDTIENRVVGIKSREIYEAPALLVLVKAHEDLEALTLTSDVTHYKRAHVDEMYSRLIYDGLWFNPLKSALDAFINETQERVSGTVRIKFLKGNATIVGRRSDYSLYSPDLSTYGADDKFDHKAAEGFIYVWGLSTRVWAEKNK